MRPKILIFVIGAAGAMLAVLIWARFGHADGGLTEASPTVSTEGASPVVAVAAAPSASPAQDAPVAAAAPADAASGADSTPAPSEKARLLELASHNDAESLREILTDLTSPEADLRQAALEAARQFGSRDAIPFLSEVADRTDDAREKVKILDTIDYLKMPSLSELRATVAQSTPEIQ